ncbi:MAG: alpha/beta hydrolase [Candidatus Eremiobacteraeota bacterium]|nr:alpha/beta hydrolase [Candidatus Eremiobacteraeota bacterium]
MNNLRKYGKPPYKVAVIHGGPGVSGEMAPVARELSSICGILEPLQTADSLDGQVAELHNVLMNNTNFPAVLIGHSWGAMLGFIYTSRFPLNVKKLILVGCGSLEAEHAKEIMATRLSRLDQLEKLELLSIFNMLDDPATRDKNDKMNRLGVLIDKTDSFCPLPGDDDVIEFRGDIYQSVWNEAARLRREGKFLKMGSWIRCPVVAIHGDYDPHPFKGVVRPLEALIDNFRLILLEKCGHVPWLEKYGKDKFYEVLKKELEREFQHIDTE